MTWWQNPVRYEVYLPPDVCVAAKTRHRATYRCDCAPNIVTTT